MSAQTIPQDPSLPPLPHVAEWYPGYCDCPRPIPQERAEQHGAAGTYCARCDRDLPPKMGNA
jgi:hypothetical protein